MNARRIIDWVFSIFLGSILVVLFGRLFGAWGYVAAGLLLAAMIAVYVRRERREAREWQRIRALTACPECGVPLDLQITQHSHEGQVATDIALEHCSKCGYTSLPFTLVFPLDPEIHALLKTEEQASNIAQLSAYGAWVRMKQKEAEHSISS